MKQQFKERIDSYYRIVRFIFIILLVCALGLYIINATFAWEYKSNFLQTPCQFCAHLNPNQSKCIEGCFQTITKIFPDGSGGWKDEKGNQINNLPEKSLNLSALLIQP